MDGTQGGGQLAVPGSGHCSVVYCRLDSGPAPTGKARGNGNGSGLPCLRRQHCGSIRPDSCGHGLYPQGGILRQGQTAHGPLWEAAAAGRRLYGCLSHCRGGTAGRRGCGAAGIVLRQLCAPDLLCPAGAADAALCLSAPVAADRSDPVCLCAADPCCHHGCAEGGPAAFEQILGRLRQSGRQLSGKSPELDNIESVRRRCSPSSGHEPGGGAFPPGDHEGADHAAQLCDHHGLCSLRRHGPGQHPGGTGLCHGTGFSGRRCGHDPAGQRIFSGHAGFGQLLPCGHERHGGQ